MIRHRGDHQQADVLETWLQTVIDDYAENILELTEAEAQVWGRLRVLHYELGGQKCLAFMMFLYLMPYWKNSVKVIIQNKIKFLHLHQKYNCFLNFLTLSQFLNATLKIMSCPKR